MSALNAKAGRQPVAMADAIGRIDPGRLLLADDFYRFGSAAFVAGEPSLGEIFFLRGIEMYPEDPVLRYNLALLYLQESRLEEGQRQLLETIRVARGHFLESRAEERLRQFFPPP